MNDRFVAREIHRSGDADGRLITVALLEILSRYQTVTKSYFSPTPASDTKRSSRNVEFPAVGNCRKADTGQEAES